MTPKDYIEIAYWVVSLLILIATVYYIATGPVNAVKIGRQLNNEQQKDNAKRNLFLTLYALRGTPLHYDFVKCLNQIEIVFEDTPTVLTAWREYFASLNIRGQVNEAQTWDLLRANLLSAMAVSLGYSRVQQTDMIQNYYPAGHEHRDIEDWELRQAAKDYLKSGHELYKSIIAKNKENGDNH